jgi:hypothetical protein
MNLIQYVEGGGARRVAIVESPDTVRPLAGEATVYGLAGEAIEAAAGLAKIVAAKVGDERADYGAIVEDGRLLAPLDHPDPAHATVTGTGLTHLGSAATRDSMHQKAEAEAGENLTDSMKMFRMGLEGGRPAAGAEGVQPEWFYKGDGAIVAAPEGPLLSPAFALDGGEEPEIAGLYVVGPDGTPFRVGFALGNEFSDHVTERQNYLFLAHSKLRMCAVGPELRLGALPGHIEGTSRIRHGGQVIWEKPFLSGEDNMSHTIANLEHHHFKYGLFRRPGDVHIHFFGTATLSFADGIVAAAGDTFEIEAAPFGRPLRNTLEVAAAGGLAAVKQL